MALSNFNETKKALEKVFEANWTDTQIHYGDSEFDSSEVSEWINPVYQPITGYVTGIGGASVNSMGSLHVVCWGEDDVDAHTIADNVVAMFLNNLPTGIYSTKYDINDQGHSANDQSFLMITFPIKSFIGAC